MSELSKNKKLKKLYDFGDHINPRKWAKAIDILVPEDGSDDSTSYLDIPFDQYTTVKTTYEDARALYESGGMKKGVFYEFSFYYSHFETVVNDTIGELYLNIPDLKVYIDKHNDLKAKGSYTLYKWPSRTLSFTSDYSFTPLSKITGSYTNEDGGWNFTKAFLKSQNLYILDLSTSALNETLEIFDKLGVKYGSPIFDDFEEYPTYLPIYDCYIVSVSDDWEGRIIYTRSGYVIDLDDYSGILNYSYCTKGVLYNLDYGGYKHSYLTNVNYTDYEWNSRSILVLCDVDNSEFQIITGATLYINKGDIRHCNIQQYADEWGNSGSYEYTIYAVHTNIKLGDHDQNDTIETINIGYDYSGGTYEYKYEENDNPDDEEDW